MEGGKDGMYMMKLFGALMILLGCGGAGFFLAAGYHRQEHNLQQLIRALEYMECELQYKMTPLPELCSSASGVCTGCLQRILLRLSMELESQITPNAATCMHAVVTKHEDISESLRKCLMQLGDSLGRFDLNGQLQGLSSVKKCTEFELEKHRQNQDVRVRSYQTLGLCAGAFLVILFL